MIQTKIENGEFTQLYLIQSWILFLAYGSTISTNQM